ncbi:DNA repair protein RecN [Corynebacterium kozikiae]|uniref:DNA repair protein RecN n=1 Tax=Corynebacterium kozikiae TaxID=2968469 RepID=UPI00211CC22C|nr:DNA repair protein RecN [Corynebacterium sp. 76QC2CO]MCQ9343883.1 DNA repair protein RecN [Corynebacterium sp. 76QC2CO]
MLADLSIENLGVISTSSLEFGAGLTVLTGETGAGKTMVVTSLRLLAGGRADASKVRTQATQAAVEGRFSVDQLAPHLKQQVIAMVEGAGGELDENGEIIASRTISEKGRSKAYLGGRSVPASHLAEFSGELLTIHGQNDQLRLLHPDQQLEALDRADGKIEALKAAYLEQYRKFQKLSKELAERKNSRMELAQEIDRLEFAIQEIQGVDPQQGEDAELQVSIKRLQAVDELREQTVLALGSIDGAQALEEFAGAGGPGGGSGDESLGASDLVGHALGALRGSSDPALQAISERLEEVAAALRDVSGELGAFLSDLPADPAALEEMLQRQQQIKALTRKYAPDVDGVLQWLAKAQARLEAIDISPLALEQLEKDVAASQVAMMKAAEKLSAARRKAITALSEAVTAELRGLAMPKSVFGVRHEVVAPRPSGIDAVEFTMAHNQSAKPQPLASSASGGELSRIMLALEVILSAGTAGTTLVFDEVDAGVGGRAAVEIGRRLAKLATNNQVIVVTHLPQVAAYADTHLHVVKDVADDSVTSGVEHLDEQRRVEELARMLAGLDDTDTGRAHAQELLDKAQQEVESLRAG